MPDVKCYGCLKPITIYDPPKMWFCDRCKLALPQPPKEKPKPPEPFDAYDYG